jgi:hypothetical protein
MSIHELSAKASSAWKRKMMTAGWPVDSFHTTARCPNNLIDAAHMPQTRSTIWG